jgi:predicted transcriptional regulator of viral defense system
MNYRDKLNKLLEKNDGLILTEDIEKVNIPRQYLSIFLKENKLEKISYGVYKKPNAVEDELYILQRKNKKAIFSHETSLFLLDLTDRDPINYSVTVPYGYNATHLRKKELNVYSVKKDLHHMGVIETKSFYGHLIKIYNKERTLCDILKNRNNMDNIFLNDSLKKYLNSKEKNIPLLLKYASKLSIKSVVKDYLEKLL